MFPPVTAVKETVALTMPEPAGSLGVATTVAFDELLSVSCTARRRDDRRPAGAGRLHA